MKKESKICPLCNKACIIQYKSYKNIWKCTCGYEESLSNNTYVSSRGKILRNDNVFLTTKRKRTNSPKITVGRTYQLCDIPSLCKGERRSDIRLT